MRYILSCLSGIAISLSLFLMMTYLIEKHEAPQPATTTVVPVFIPFEELEQVAEATPEVEPPPPVTSQPIFDNPIYLITPMDSIDLPTPPRPVQVGITDIPVKSPEPAILGKIPPPDLTVLVGSRVKYPESAERRNLEGYVVVENEVDQYGKVVDVRVIESSHRVFEKAAREAVFKWKYSNSELNKRIDKKRIAFKLDN